MLLEKYKEDIKYLHHTIKDKNLTPDEILEKEDVLTHSIEQAIDHYCQRRQKITGDTSDGFHTFNELYRYRLLYNAALFNEWFTQGKYDIHKSERHSDGQLCFGGGWFVVVAQLPTGQVTNHYELKDWYLFKAAIRKRAAKWDGHTPEAAAQRLEAMLPEKPENYDFELVKEGKTMPSKDYWFILLLIIILFIGFGFIFILAHGGKS